MSSVHEHYRSFIGGDDQYWDIVADLQIEFLIQQGLRPEHVFIDVACGALRGGTRFIPYLGLGNYLGLDKYIELIIYGVANELGVDTFAQKRPRFVVSDTFEFEHFGASPEFGIAQSLFSHLDSADIIACLTKLRQIAADGCRFFATFFEATASSGYSKAEQSHSHRNFFYTRAEMEGFGEAAGWRSLYIGDWQHPRGQRIIEYRAD